MQIGLLARLSLCNDPFFGAAFQQRPSIERDSLLKRRKVTACDGGVEGGYVHERLREIQAQGVERGGLNPIRLIAERAAQVGQALAQVFQGIALQTVRPEGSGQPAAIHLPIRTQRQQRQRPLYFARAQARQRPVFHARIKRSEKC